MSDEELEKGNTDLEPRFIFVGSASINSAERYCFRAIYISRV